ncbi:MAG: hypothetical protein COT89_01065 [Candidatus Colwellbacteria bacterium CG10_big_fil_rev_8_21_14_0_10_42_22]|uniref:Uncharacterized protein n=1 Tax=Candidatus Colwellbacteria bacterium CG10_big_fil_rev_8_21_14_0_10_42_22 TaxID=1974540 RepID=A0A2H0VG99_9BACT|nr:MAG: hypothetical protein COT89_01065 [Candidatus Colwellbacteria bacterium CG10_big_fil_rev_8_21_14_0_10_42_22]
MEYGNDENSYFDELKKRAGESHVYSEHQMVGLMLAEILGDDKHKSLYMKLAKDYDADRLLRLAKDIADRPNVENRGAYFMKMLYNGKNLDNK